MEAGGAGGGGVVAVAEVFDCQGEGFCDVGAELEEEGGGEDGWLGWMVVGGDGAGGFDVVIAIIVVVV